MRQAVKSKWWAPMCALAGGAGAAGHRLPGAGPGPSGGGGRGGRCGGGVCACGRHAQRRTARHGSLAVQLLWSPLLVAMQGISCKPVQSSCELSRLPCLADAPTEVACRVAAASQVWAECTTTYAPLLMAALPAAAAAMAALIHKAVSPVVQPWLTSGVGCVNQQLKLVDMC